MGSTIMSTPQPPAEPQPPESAESFPGSDAEFDLPYTAPAPSPRPRRQSPGAIRAFLFLTAAFIVGAFIGQLLGVALGVLLLLLRGQLALRDLPALLEALPELVQQPVVMFCMGGVSLVLTLLVTLLFARGWDRRPLNSIGFQWDAGAGLQFAAGLALGGALMGAIFAVELGLGWARVAGMTPLPGSLAHAALWLVVLLPAAAQEEVMLRGYTFQALQEQWGGAAATILTALVFGALHNLNPHSGWRSLAGIFVSGILFGAAVLATGRLWLPIGLHAAWNLFEGPILGFPVSGIPFPGDVRTVVSGPTLWTGGGFGPEAGLLGVLASALGALVLLAARRRTLSGPD
jgi:membrane protease YdiL (CAAX protease family)